MTLPVPSVNAPLADTYKHINDLRAAARAAINDINYVSIADAALTSDANGRFSYVVSGLTTVQGAVFNYRTGVPGNTMTIIIRGISGKTITGDIWLAATGSGNYANSPWQGTLVAHLFAWGVK